MLFTMPLQVTQPKQIRFGDSKLLRVGLQLSGFSAIHVALFGKVSWINHFIVHRESLWGFLLAFAFTQKSPALMRDALGSEETIQLFVSGTARP